MDNDDLTDMGVEYDECKAKQLAYEIFSTSDWGSCMSKQKVCHKRIVFNLGLGFLTIQLCLLQP